MPIHRKDRKTTTKYRGHRTMGRGKKAGRGKGKRGGTGNAGLHKHKYLWTVKYDPLHFGVHGFTMPDEAQNRLTAINVQQLEERWAALAGAAAGPLDLGTHGIDKLLGGGRVSKPLQVKVKWASPQAVEKIKAAGGKVEATERRVAEIRAEARKAAEAKAKAAAKGQQAPKK
jgi:large subunit ribosomal protein L15